MCFIFNFLRCVKFCYGGFLFGGFPRLSLRSEIILMTPIPCLKFDAELDAALNVQERIFPTARPVVPGLDYFGDWRPARGVGGDYIDYFEMNDGNLGVAVGDVCGKGVPSALLTSSLHSMIRGLRCARKFRLKTLVQTIDKLFCEICPDNCYATLFVGEYDPLSGQLRYVNAGHEPPFVLRKQGRLFQTVFLEATGPMIGMLRPTTYREGMVSLRPGDVLVAYTDGLCDTTSRVGEEWGWQRFLKTVEECSDQRARDIVEGVMRAAEAFAGGAPQHDDVTLFVGRVQNSAAVRPYREAERALVATAA
jgi:phosphoserine phosphatase RsbU/P